MIKLWKSLGIDRTVLALSLARMGDAVGNSILFILIPLYVAVLPSMTFHFSIPVLVGLLISSYGLAAAALQPFTAALSDRFGHQKFLIQVGLALLGIASLAFIWAVRFLDLLGLRILQGLGLALAVPPTMAIMTLATKKENRGNAMGFYTTLRMLGLTLGPLIGGFTHVRLGFDAAFIAAGIILFSAIIVVQLWVKDMKLSPEPGGLQQGTLIFEASLMLDPGILSAAFATFSMAATFTLITTLENEFITRLDINAFHFSMAFSALMVGRLLFQVPLGRFSDRIGRRPLILAGLFLLAPVTALLGEAATLFQLTLLRFVEGIAAAAIVAPALAFAGDVAKSGGESRQTSVVTLGFSLGTAIGPLLAGFLSIVSFELPFLASGLLCFVGAYMVYRHMPETVQKKHGGLEN